MFFLLDKAQAVGKFFCTIMTDMWDILAQNNKDKKCLGLLNWHRQISCNRPKNTKQNKQGKTKQKLPTPGMHPLTYYYMSKLRIESIL